MSATLSAVETATRIPANVMGLLRQSYDSREKALDWLLAIGVSVALVYCFRDEIRGFVGTPEAGPNAGAAPDPQPNQDIGTAFPFAGPDGGRWPALYAYNMPPSRNIRSSVGPSGMMPPANPSLPPTYEQPRQ